MFYEPLQDYVLIVKHDAAEKIGNIMLPESAKPKNIGVVTQVGPGRVTDDGSVVAVKVPVGKKVLYNRAIELTDGYMLVKENEILCVVTE